VGFYSINAYLIPRIDWLYSFKSNDFKLLNLSKKMGSVQVQDDFGR
jgi:hypothetical protein